MATATASRTQHARSAAHEYGPPAARAGWVAKGVVYAVVGILTVQLAFGDRTAPDQQGAVRAVADQPFGTVLLALLAAGLVAYAVGRLLEASVLAEPDLDGFERAKMVGSAIAYGAVAVAAVRVLTGSGGTGGRRQAQSMTADLMDAPAGRWLVGAVGLAFVGAGIYEAWQGLSRKFLEELDTASMDRGVRRTAELVGTAGRLARGVAWSLVGFFLVRAAVQFDPSEAKGLDQALRSLADESWGTIVLLAIAVGFLGYFAYCLLQARYRRLGHG